MWKKILDYDLLRFDYDLLTPFMESLMNDEVSIDKVITKGKPVKVGNRTIYPVIMTSSIEFNSEVTYESITPFALAVIELDERYFIPLDEENERIQELLSEDGLWDEIGLG